MTYNFDSCPDRRGTESVKWDMYPGTLPLWVADMDFEVAPEIRAALQRRLDHGVFGYELVPDDYYACISRWFATRHDWEGIEKQNIIPTTGVIAAYSAAIKATTVPGDKVLVQTPCYNAFFPAIRNNKCELLESPLHFNGVHYIVDWDDFEAKAAQAKVFLLCNPHNPVGRVWTREELLLMAEICQRNKVFIISDEIHCELTYPGHDYTPFATLPEQYVHNSVTCFSPTKPFNIAGIQIANIFASTPELYAKMDRAINDNECCDVNVFGVTALKAAYTEGGPWLDELRNYLYHNARAVNCFLEDELPGVTVPPLEGTYLVWVDVTACCDSVADYCDRILQETGVRFNPGTMYGEESGEGYLRINIACPRSLLMEAMERMKEFKI